MYPGCTAFWCPCVTYGSNRTRRLALERNGAPHPEGGTSTGGDCLLFGLVQCVSGFGWVLEVSSQRQCSTVHSTHASTQLYQVSERGNTRQRYKISGNQCGDCMATFWCLPCVLTQESREIEGEERSCAEGHGQQGPQLLT